MYVNKIGKNVDFIRHISKLPVSDMGRPLETVPSLGPLHKQA